jgi:hypothetical protein
MDGDSSILGLTDSDARMVNELEKDGSGGDAVMVCDELKDKEGDWVHVEELEEPVPDIVEVQELAGDCVIVEDPAGEDVGLAEEEALIVEDQEGPAVGDMVLDQEG